MNITARVVDDTNSLSTIVTLLKENSLPTSDVAVEGNLFVSYHDNHDNIIGTGGLEFYGEFSLLRSISVTSSKQGSQIGRTIVLDLINRAMEKSVKHIYLLTETASGFFTKLGFETIARLEVPDAVKASSEFSTVCPVSAICMVLYLNP